MKRYENWSMPTINDPKKIYIGYVTCYGYTAKLAEKLYEGADQDGVEVEIEDVSKIAASEVAAKIHNADAFALGSPTLNRDVLKPVWDVMTSLCSYVVKGKHAAVFGTYAWSGEACKYMERAADRSWREGGWRSQRRSSTRTKRNLQRLTSLVWTSEKR